MKVIHTIIFIFHITLVVNLLGSSIPFAGKISKDGINLEGQIKFFFQIHDGQGKTLWKSGKHAEDLVTVTVRGGRYIVQLGGSGMEEIDEQLFLDHDQLYLNLLVDLGDGQGLQTLGPDERITSVPHALAADWAAKARRAEVADAVADGAISKSMLQDSLQRELNAPISASRFDPALITYLAPMLAPVPTSEVADYQLLKNTNFTLSGPEARGRNLFYQWFRNGQKVEGATGKNLEFKNLSIARDQGTYEVVVANDFGEFRQTLQLNIFEIGASAIEAGHAHALYINTEGFLYGFGKNSSGQLGGPAYYHSSPKLVFDQPVVTAAAGSNSSLFVTRTGELWGVGNIAHFHGITSNPIKILDDSVRGIAVGNNCHYVIKGDKSLWAFGENSKGQLGDGTNTDRSQLVRIFDGGVKQIAANNEHAAVVKEDGSLWTFGKGLDGQLGNGKKSEFESVPFQLEQSGVVQAAVGARTTLYVKADGSLWATGANWFNSFGPIGHPLSPIKIVNSGVRKVVAGYDFFLYLDENGSVWGRGGNNELQLGFDSSSWSVHSKFILSGAEEIETGSSFSFVRLKDGRMLTLGNNYWGQLGDGKMVQTQVPVKIPGIQVKAAAANTNGSYLIDKQGSLWSFGIDDWGDLGNGLKRSSLPQRVVEKRVISVSSIHKTVLFQEENGSLLGFGHGNYGKLGNNSTTSQNSPSLVGNNQVISYAAGGDHGAMVLEDGSLWTFGRNNYGQLGDGNKTDRLSPVKIVQQSVTQVATGWNHTLFLVNDGSVWGMGRNNDGQLGGDNQSDQLVPKRIIASGAKWISAGHLYSFVGMTDGSLLGFGNGHDFRLGYPSSGIQRSPVLIIDRGIKHAVGASTHSLFLMEDGSLWAAGQNTYGKVGAGSIDQKMKLTKIVNSGVAGMAAGINHSIYWTDSGDCFLFGSNQAGQLGTGGMIKSSEPILVK